MNQNPKMDQKSWNWSKFQYWSKIQKWIKKSEMYVIKNPEMDQTQKMDQNPKILRMSQKFKNRSNPEFHQNPELVRNCRHTYCCNFSSAWSCNALNRSTEWLYFWVISLSRAFKISSFFRHPAITSFVLSYFL